MKNMVQKRSTYRLNQNQDTEDSIKVDDDDEENAVRDSDVNGRPTFNHYWMQQLMLAGFKKEDTIEPKFGAFARYMADEFTPNEL